MMVVIRLKWSLISNSGSDHAVQGTQVITNGCMTLFGIRLQLAGVVTQNGDPNSLLCIMYFRCPVSRMSNKTNQVIDRSEQ
jgi:hypothetical protein